MKEKRRAGEPAAPAGEPAPVGLEHPEAGQQQKDGDQGHARVNEIGNRPPGANCDSLRDGNGFRGGLHGGPAFQALRQNRGSFAALISQALCLLRRRLTLMDSAALKNQDAKKLSVVALSSLWAQTVREEIPKSGDT
jgi:hypothetical protein